MQIALKDPSKTPMWFIPGTNLHLTFQAPGPIPVDVSKLTEIQKRQIQMSIERQVLVCDEPMETRQVKLPETLVIAYQGNIMPPAPAIPLKVEPVKPAIDVWKEKREKNIGLLKLPYGQLKPKLDGLTQRELTDLLQLEDQGKKRPKVMKELHRRVEEGFAKVEQAILKDKNSGKQISFSLGKDFENLPEIEESEVNKVTVPLTPDQLLQSDEYTVEEE